MSCIGQRSSDMSKKLEPDKIYASIKTGLDTIDLRKEDDSYSEFTPGNQFRRLV